MRHRATAAFIGLNKSTRRHVKEQDTPFQVSFEGTAYLVEPLVATVQTVWTVVGVQRESLTIDWEVGEETTPGRKTTYV